MPGRWANDEYGRIYSKQLSELPLQSEIRVGEGTTGSSIILVSPDSERTMNTYLGINRQFSFADVSEAVVREAAFLYFTGYLWDTELQKEAILRTLALAKRHGCTIVFDVADPFAVSRNRDEFHSIIHRVRRHHLRESRRGENTPGDGRGSRRGPGVGGASAAWRWSKNGAEGSLVMSAKDLYEIPVCRQTPVDTTGAGDMYAAGFLYGLVRGLPLDKAGVCASYLASQIVIQRGAQFTADKRAEVAQVVRSGGWDFT